MRAPDAGLLEDGSGETLEEAAEQLMRESVLAGGDDEDDEDADSLMEALTWRHEKVQPAEEEAPAGAAGRTYDEAQRGNALGDEVQAPASAAGGEEPEEALAGEEPDEQEEDEGYEPDEERTGSEDGLDALQLVAAAADSAGWGRLVRQPRKRGKHIILDVCAPLTALPDKMRAATQRAIATAEQGLQSGSGGSAAAAGSRRGARRRGKRDDSAVELSREGALVQQVVAVGDKRGWLGPAGYSLARSARWGDLWPGHYLRRAVTAKVSLQELSLTGAELRAGSDR